MSVGYVVPGAGRFCLMTQEVTAGRLYLSSGQKRRRTRRRMMIISLSTTLIMITCANHGNNVTYSYDSCYDKTVYNAKPQDDVAEQKRSAWCQCEV